jgi:guanylate kinase
MKQLKIKIQNLRKEITSMQQYLYYVQNYETADGLEGIEDIIKNITHKERHLKKLERKLNTCSCLKKQKN